MDINTDRRCEHCGHDWRGSVECHICGHLDNLGGVVTLCAWCPTSAALTEEAHAQGLETTHGMCGVCAVTLWTDATEAKAIRDEAGRIVAPPQSEPQPRPDGPWSQNEAPLKVVCCYCTPWHTIREGAEPASHGACPVGVARFEAGF